MIITKNGQATMMVFELEGRLDTTTSADLQEALLSFFQDGKNLVLDFAKLVYVSSAGLRALLIGQKTANTKGGSMTIKNVSENIMDVFQMTGFDGILSIE